MIVFPPAQCRRLAAWQWTTDELRHYISWVRGEFQPQLSSGAALLLQRYYELRRRTLQRVYGAEQDQAVAGRTTLRLLESLVRITQAHARLMARQRTHVEVSQRGELLLKNANSFNPTFLLF